MSRLRKLAASVASLIVAGTVFATPAFAINTAPCGTRTDFFKVWYNSGANTVCYANNGGVPVSYHNVTRITTGNNSGNFELYQTLSDGSISGGYWYFAHYTVLNFNPKGNLYYITITGR